MHTIGRAKITMATKKIVNKEILCSFSINVNCPVLGRHRLFTECEDVFGHGKYYGA